MSEREFSRCETCGKRLAFLGPAQPRPCPRDEADPAYCSEVINALVLARQIRQQLGGVMEPFHPETLDLLARTGMDWATIDAIISRRARSDADERFLRYDTTILHPVADWINGDRDRALIVAKWALDEINVCDGSTMAEIARMQSDLAEDLTDYIDGLSSDLEMDVGQAIY